MVRKISGQSVNAREYSPELKRWVDAFLDYSAIRNYSRVTIQQRRYHLLSLLAWFDERSIVQLEQITADVMNSYQRYLFHYRQDNGKPLSVTAQRARLMSIRAWFRWLRKAGHQPQDPCLDMELPKEERRLPRGVLTASEVEQIMIVPDVQTPLGLRNRAMLELLYSTAMRRTELTGLKVHDVDTQRRVISIWCGKGRKDRVVPFGERALGWLEQYLETTRPRLLVDPRETTLFLTYNGRPFVSNALSDIVRKCVRAADVSKRGSCHLLRHTAATLMLDAGANVRYIQELLGHEELTTTQIYTHVSITELQKVHDRTHPARPKDQSQALRHRQDDDETRAVES
jgi:integrase/recombinase XerD